MEMDGHYSQNSGKLQKSKTASQDASIVHIFNNLNTVDESCTSIKYKTMYKH